MSDNNVAYGAWPHSIIPPTLAKLWETKDFNAISHYQLDDDLVLRGNELAKWTVFPWANKDEVWFDKMRAKMILQFGTQLPQFILADLFGFVNGKSVSIIRWERSKGEPSFVPQASLRLEDKAKSNLEAVYHWVTAESRAIIVKVEK